jgi:hypothetical protein
MKQGKRIYCFVRDHAPDHLEEWRELERGDSRPTKEQASTVISAIHQYEAGEVPTGYVENEFIGVGMPDGFTITGGQDKPEQPEQDAKQAGSEGLGQVLDALGMVLNRDTLDKLRDALAREVGKYKDQVEQLEADLLEALGTPKEAVLPTLEPLGDQYIKHPLFDRVSCYVRSGLNVLLTGPAGTGKSMMGREIAKALGHSFFEMSLGGRMQYAQVIGSTRLKDGESFFEPSPLVKALQDENRVVVLNEIFGLDPEVLLAFNDALEAGTRHIRTPAGKVKVKARVIATANTTGRSVSRQYTGAQRADDSLLSRFGAKIHIGVDERVESKLLEQITDEKARADIQERVRGLRDGLKESNIPFDAGTRELCNCIANYAATGNVKIAFEDSFLGGLSKAERAKLNV